MDRLARRRCHMSLILRTDPERATPGSRLSPAAVPIQKAPDRRARALTASSIEYTPDLTLLAIRTLPRGPLRSSAAFERRLWQRKLLDARLGRRGPSPVTPAARTASLGEASEGGKAPSVFLTARPSRRW